MACLRSDRIYLAPSITARSIGVGDAVALELLGGRLEIGPVQTRFAQHAVTGQHAIIAVIRTEVKSVDR